MFTDDLARHHGYTSRSFLISVMIDDPAYLIGRVPIPFPAVFPGHDHNVRSSAHRRRWNVLSLIFPERRERTGREADHIMPPYIRFFTRGSHDVRNEDSSFSRTGISASASFPADPDDLIISFLDPGLSLQSIRVLLR